MVDFDHTLGLLIGKCVAANDILYFSAGAITLTLDNGSRQQDGFKIENGELVLVQLVIGVQGNTLGQCPDQLTKPSNRQARHDQINAPPCPDPPAARSACLPRSVRTVGPSVRMCSRMSAARGRPLSSMTSIR